MSASSEENSHLHQTQTAGYSAGAIELNPNNDGGGDILLSKSSNSSSDSAASHNRSGEQDHDDDDDEMETDEMGELIAAKQPLSYSKIAVLTLGFAVIEFEWAMLYAYGNPILRELGTNQIMVGLAWSLSPIIIMFAQPFIGVYSDRCTSRYGRRRPFLFATACVCISALILLPHAEFFAGLLAGPTWKPTVAIAVGSLAVMLIDLTNEVIYYLLRALLVDVLPSYQSEIGNSMCSWMLSAGGLLGNMMGAVDFGAYFGDDSEGASIRWIFFICLVVFVIAFSFNLVVIHEKPLKKPKKDAPKNPLVEIFQFLNVLPKTMFRICLIDFFGWFALFTFFMYGTDWVGENVYRGSPRADEASRLRFEEGVRYGAFAMAMTNVVTLLFAPAVPHLIDKLSLKRVYFYTHVFLAVVMLLPWFITTPTPAFFVMLLVGIPYAVNETIPYVYISRISGDRNIGLYLAVLQNFAVGAKLSISLFVGEVITLFGGDVSAALALGALSSAAAAYLIMDLPEIKKSDANVEDHREKEEKLMV